jgi:hypothetical protein
MKWLVAVTTCHKRNDRADSQRKTWAKDSPIDVRFFYGGDGVHGDNSILLDCPDDYEHFTLKTRAVCRWALENGYDRICKCDDDVYLRPERLNTTDDYFGFVCNMIAGIPQDNSFCMGSCYCLSKESMSILIDAVPATKYELQQEDEWVGRQLINADILPCHTDLIRQDLAYKLFPIEAWYPMVDNQIISIASFENAMHIPHKIWLDSIAMEEKANGFTV